MDCDVAEAKQEEQTLVVQTSMIDRCGGAFQVLQRPHRKIVFYKLLAFEAPMHHTSRSIGSIERNKQSFLTKHWYINSTGRKRVQENNTS